MRTHVLSPDLHGQIDGTIAANLLSGFPDQSSSKHDCDVVIVPISFFSDFKFNTLLHGGLDKPWVLIDYLEYEWNFDMPQGHFLGVNTRDCRWLSPEWWDFCDFVRDNPPVIYFKRELPRQAVSDRYVPIDWPCYIASQPFQSEEEFNQRPIEVFFSWGFSHPSRPQLHADIFRAMTTHGLGVISEHDQFEGYFKNPCARTWASIFVPWYTRRPISDIAWYQMRSKMSVSLPGCGRKCFRHAEAPVGTIMALGLDDLAWSFPWTDGDNCIRLNPLYPFESLEQATKRADLYKIYVRSQETIELYRTKPYVQNYVIPTIQSAL